MNQWLLEFIASVVNDLQTAILDGTLPNVQRRLQKAFHHDLFGGPVVCRLNQRFLPALKIYHLLISLFLLALIVSSLKRHKVFQLLEETDLVLFDDVAVKDLPQRILNIVQKDDGYVRVEVILLGDAVLHIVHQLRQHILNLDKQIFVL